MPKTKIPESKKVASASFKELSLEDKKECNTTTLAGLKTSEQVENSSITPPSVPHSSKKAEGSKQL